MISTHILITVFLEAVYMCMHMCVIECAYLVKFVISDNVCDCLTCFALFLQPIFNDMIICPHVSTCALIIVSHFECSHHS